MAFPTHTPHVLIQMQHVTRRGRSGKPPRASAICALRRQACEPPAPIHLPTPQFLAMASLDHFYPRPVDTTRRNIAPKAIFCCNFIDYTNLYTVGWLAMAIAPANEQRGGPSRVIRPVFGWAVGGPQGHSALAGRNPPPRGGRPADICRLDVSEVGRSSPSNVGPISSHR